MINNALDSPGVYRPMKLWFFVFSMLLFFNPLSEAQDPSHLIGEISFYADAMVNAKADDHRARAHRIMTNAIDSLIGLPSSYDIPLDSIPWLSVLQGDDFRIVTWQWKVSEEEYKYGGFLQGPDRLIRLKDTRPFINGSGYNTYTANAWYGALYYQIIPFDREGKRLYLLLGFNAENSSINTKVADILDLTGPELKLGVPVFLGNDEPLTRILISYADVSTVHIRYDKMLGGIIYDHIEDLPGVGIHGETMPVSDGSLEGWIQKDGNWMYQEEVFDLKVDTPPMTDDRKERKEDKDILGRPKKQ